jgi:hypothetical protein
VSEQPDWAALFAARDLAEVFTEGAEDDEDGAY